MAALAGQLQTMSITSTPRWQWYEDINGIWQDYDANTSAAISEAVNNGTGILRFNHNNNSYEINTFEMLQMNYNTNRRRLIRCMSGNNVKWQWYDDGWQDYAAADSQALTAALQSGDGYVTFQFLGNSYTVYLNIFTQKNTATGYSRRIRQVVVPPAVPTPIAGAAAAPDPSSVDITCAICFERAKDTAFIPCGHTFCRTCAARIAGTSGKCPLCRVPIQKRLPLIIS